MSVYRVLSAAFGVIAMLLATAGPSRADVGERAVSRAFLTLVAGEQQDLPHALEVIESTWKPSHLPMALDVLRLIRNPGASVALVQTMQRETGAEHGGVNHALGTSGFLYRSNKLMYDQVTQSLWSTMRGIPVAGPLAGKGIVLARGSVVTTTWGEWRRRHPDTRVLSLDTGHRRDYAEGAAYRNYFATDEVMFAVPALDSRLKNKDEVFTVLLASHPNRPLAISADYLAANPVHHESIEDTSFVVLTDPTGANRAYASDEVSFTAYDGDRSMRDSEGGSWTLTEHALRAEDGRVLHRIPAQRAFWFGWYSAFPHTRLVH